MQYKQIAHNKLKNGIINKNNLIPLYSLTCRIIASNIGNTIIERIIVILFLKLLKFEIKNCLSFFKKNINANNNIKIKMGILNTKKLRKYVLGVLVAS